MSYGDPWEQGVGEADPTPLLSLDEPGLVPGASGSILGAKKAQKGRYQRRKRRRLREDAAARKMRCVNDQDSCMGMMAEMIEENRREMVCVSRVVDHFEEIFRSDFEKMRSEARKEVVKEKNNMLMVMSSLSKMWRLLAAKGEGVVLGDAPAVFGDCGVDFDVIGEAGWRMFCRSAMVRGV